jgi:hypothetical protein
MIQKIKDIVRLKPVLFVVVSIVYTLCTVLLKWNIKPQLDAAWFIGGSFIGIYFLEVAEEFFQLSPSPFRSVVFSAGFTLVSFFIVSSSSGYLARGLVLTIYLTLILRSIGQWAVVKNIDNWYQMFSKPVAPKYQLYSLMIFIALFFIETYLFIRS